LIKLRRTSSTTSSRHARATSSTVLRTMLDRQFRRPRFPAPLHRDCSPPLPTPAAHSRRAPLVERRLQDAPLLCLTICSSSTCQRRSHVSSMLPIPVRPRAARKSLESAHRGPSAISLPRWRPGRPSKRRAGGAPKSVRHPHRSETP
jgi:hypothetical protein